MRLFEKTDFDVQCYYDDKWVC